jgi:hypothetical protein
VEGVRHDRSVGQRDRRQQTAVALGADHVAARSPRGVTLGEHPQRLGVAPGELADRHASAVHGSVVVVVLGVVSASEHRLLLVNGLARRFVMGEGSRAAGISAI